MKSAGFGVMGTLMSAAGRRLSLTMATSLALGGAAVAGVEPVVPVEAPYFCNSQVRSANEAERAICADKGLQLLYNSLDFELEDAMSQAIHADKIQLLDRLKAGHEPWEMNRDRACPNAATKVACLRSLYESRRRDLASLLRAEGLKSVAAQARESGAADAQRNADADRERERDAQERAQAQRPAPNPASPEGTAKATAPVKPEPIATPPSKSHDAAQPDKPFDWPGLIGWVAIAIGGYTWWSVRKQRTANKAQSALAGAPGQPGEGNTAKRKWGWGTAAAVVALIVISKQGEWDRASKAISESGVAASQAGSFPSGIWQCGLLGRVEFAGAGVFRNYNPPANTGSSLLLERVGFLGVGTFTMESADQLRINVTRQVSVEASPEDSARLGDLADMRLDAIRKFKVETSGHDVVLQETFRSFNGKVKEPSRKRFVCTVQAQAQASAAAKPPAQAEHLQASVVGSLPSAQFATPSTPMTQDDGEDAVMQDMLRNLDASHDGTCRAQGQQIRMLWGYFKSSGEQRFKNEAMNVLGDLERRGCA